MSAIHELLERDDLGALRPLVNAVAENVGQLHDTLTLPMACDWTVAIENALEDIHVPLVHRTTFHRLRLVSEGMEQHGRHSVAYYRVTGEEILKGLRAIARYFPHGDPEHYFHLFLWPNVCLSSVAGFTYSLQTYEKKGKKTLLTSRLYAAKTTERAPGMGPFLDQAAEFNRKVFDEDARVCEAVRGTGEFLTDAERRVRWFREALAEDAA